MTVLNAKEHARLIADQDHVCLVAGVQKRFLQTSMTEFCSEHEVEWVRNFHQHQEEGILGLMLEGVLKPDTRCQAIAAALVRNYIDARVVPVNTLLDMVSNGSVISPTVLLIPNLFVQATTKTLPAWRVQTLYDLLLNRSTQGKPSVVYVENVIGLAAAYGNPFRDFLDGFCKVTK